MDTIPTVFDLECLGFLCGPPKFKKALELAYATRNKLPTIILENKQENEFLVIYEGPNNDYLLQYHKDNEYVRSQYWPKKDLYNSVIKTATTHADFIFIKNNENPKMA
jgi:hypothetical protein